jgi:hypothetical protein
MTPLWLAFAGFFHCDHRLFGIHEIASIPARASKLSPLKTVVRAFRA